MPAWKKLRRSRRRLAAAATVVLVCAGVASAQPDEAKSVLVLFANRSTALSAADMEPVFRRTIEPAAGVAVDLHVDYLDLIDDGSADAYEQRLVDLLLAKYRGRRFDLVLPVRAESLRFVLRHREVLFPGVPVVFTDVMQPDLETMPLPPDVTGIVNPPMASQRTISVALTLHPGAKAVTIVGGASQFDRDRALGAESLVRAHSPDLPITSLVGQSLDDQVRAVSRLGSDQVVVFTSYRADSLGRSMMAASVFRQIATASGAPVYGAAETWMGLGLVGGDLVRYDKLAKRAAELASRILRGEPASSIAPAEAPTSELMFDWRQLRRWGIDDARLPAGSVVLFREFTFFELYRWYVVGFATFAVAQTLLIGALLVERRTRRKSEAEVIEAEQRYRTVADFNYDWEYWKRPDGTYAYVSPSVVRLTGTRRRSSTTIPR